jgi:two-component system, chemotaxis family, response regulator WspR
MTHLVANTSVGNVIAWHNPGKQDNSYQDVLSSVFQQKSYSVAAFTQESEVLQAVLENVPDLLIIDLQTSGEQGYEFCKILRQLPRTGALPVVFVGTRAPFSELMSALRCGGNEYLQLPVSEEECWLRVERHLRPLQIVRSLEAERASLHQEILSYSHILQQQEMAQVSLAKENQALQRLAFTDGLTHVANRASFDEKIVQLWQQAKDYRQPISLLLCDVDYFKRYNDTYGHFAGDGCLQAVADALVRGTHRHGDQVARYGGEEFTILLPGTDSQGAQQAALSVQSELARAQVPHVSSLVKPYVSLSIGICTLTPVISSLSEAALSALEASARGCVHPSYEMLIQRADEALYAAKTRGRDRTVIYTSEGLISILPDRCCYSGPADSAHRRSAQFATDEVLPAIAQQPAIPQQPAIAQQPAKLTVPRSAAMAVLPYEAMDVIAV